MNYHTGQGVGCPPSGEDLSATAGDLQDLALLVAQLRHGAVPGAGEAVRLDLERVQRAAVLTLVGGEGDGGEVRGHFLFLPDWLMVPSYPARGCVYSPWRRSFTRRPSRPRPAPSPRWGHPGRPRGSCTRRRPPAPPPGRPPPAPPHGPRWCLPPRPRTWPAGRRWWACRSCTRRGGSFPFLPVRFLSTAYPSSGGVSTPWARIFQNSRSSGARMSSSSSSG